MSVPSGLVFIIFVELMPPEKLWRRFICKVCLFIHKLGYPTEFDFRCKHFWGNLNKMLWSLMWYICDSIYCEILHQSIYCGILLQSNEIKVGQNLPKEKLELSFIKFWSSAKLSTPSLFYQNSNDSFCLNPNRDINYSQKWVCTLCSLTIWQTTGQVCAAVHITLRLTLLPGMSW